MRTLVAYVPVLHEGYRRFFENVVGEKELYIIGEEFIDEVPVYKKDLRRLPAKTMKTAIESLAFY